MNDATEDKPIYSVEDTRIVIGNTVIELTKAELHLNAVEYLYRPNQLFQLDFKAPLEKRYAPPEQVLYACDPEAMFQVSFTGYECMCAKAKRLLDLRKRDKV